MVASVEKPREQVRYGPLELNLNYADFALARIAESTLSANDQARWLESRDLQTRGKMVELMRQNWPQGEALSHALRECEVVWTTQQAAAVNVPPELLQPEPETSHTGPKRARKERTVSILQGAAGVQTAQ